VNDSLINDIVKDFLWADSSYDPKYYNTSGNFVPIYGGNHYDFYGGDD